MASPLQRASAPDQVFERLRASILSGEYRAGERLPTQRALAADLGVNMATVREALKRLEQLRLVKIRHGDATRVLDWRRSGGLEALVLAGSGQEAIVGDLFEARRLLLVEAARLAAQRRSEEQADALLELAEAVALAGDDQSALLADWAVHGGARRGRRQPRLPADHELRARAVPAARRRVRAARRRPGEARAALRAGGRLRERRRRRRRRRRDRAARRAQQAMFG